MSNKVTRGQPLSFPASHYNDTVDLVRQWKSNRGQFLPGRGSAAGEILVGLAPGVGPVPKYGVIGLENVRYNTFANAAEFENNYLVSGQTPAGKYRQRVAITQEPIPQNGIGRAIMHGLTVANVNFTSPHYDFCDLADGDFDNLQSASTGSIQVIWSPRSPGVHLSLVRLPIQSVIPVAAALSMSLNTPQNIGTLPAGWTRVELDSVEVNENFSPNLPNNAFAFDLPGIYNASFFAAVSHNSDNSGRILPFQLNSMAGSLGIYAAGTGRNVELTNLSAVAPIIVSAGGTGVDCWWEIGNSLDSYTSVVIEAANTGMTSVSIG